MAVLVVLFGIIVSPFLALVGAIFRGLILGLPVMIILGALHGVPALAWVPTLGFWPCVGVVAVLGLLIPTSSSNKSD